MDLSEWAHQFLIRNAKLKGWKVSGEGPRYDVTTKTQQRYLVCEAIQEHEGADVIITLNTQTNLNWVASRFDDLPEARIIFTNPTTDSYWTLNITMLRKFGDVERFKKKPKVFMNDVAFV
jgi:hypothetical protein